MPLRYPLIWPCVLCVGPRRNSCWRSVAGEYRKSASIPSRGEGSPIPWPGELGRGVWVPPRVSGKRGARELERASSQSYSARNCDIYPVPCRFPVDRQPHSHRFCASTGDRKSNHQVAPIVCSQFALLSPDSATSQQYLATNLRQQCLHVEKDVVSTEAEAMPVDVFADVDAAVTVEATATPPETSARR